MHAALCEVMLAVEVESRGTHACVVCHYKAKAPLRQILLALNSRYIEKLTDTRSFGHRIVLEGVKVIFDIYWCLLNVLITEKWIRLGRSRGSL